MLGRVKALVLSRYIDTYRYIVERERGPKSNYLLGRHINLSLSLDTIIKYNVVRYLVLINKVTIIYT